MHKIYIVLFINIWTTICFSLLHFKNKKQENYTKTTSDCNPYNNAFLVIFFMVLSVKFPEKNFLQKLLNKKEKTFFLLCFYILFRIGQGERKGIFTLLFKKATKLIKKSSFWFLPSALKKKKKKKKIVLTIQYFLYKCGL